MTTRLAVGAAGRRRGHELALVCADCHGASTRRTSPPTPRGGPARSRVWEAGAVMQHYGTLGRLRDEHGPFAASYCVSGFVLLQVSRRQPIILLGF